MVGQRGNPRVGRVSGLPREVFGARGTRTQRSVRIFRPFCVDNTCTGVIVSLCLGEARRAKRRQRRVISPGGLVMRGLAEHGFRSYKEQGGGT